MIAMMTCERYLHRNFDLDLLMRNAYTIVCQLVDSIHTSCHRHIPSIDTTFDRKRRQNLHDVNKIEKLNIIILSIMRRKSNFH